MRCNETSLNKRSDNKNALNIEIHGSQAAGNNSLNIKEDYDKYLLVIRLFEIVIYAF